MKTVGKYKKTKKYLYQYRGRNHEIIEVLERDLEGLANNVVFRFCTSIGMVYGEFNYDKQVLTICGEYPCAAAYGGSHNCRVYDRDF